MKFPDLLFEVRCEWFWGAGPVVASKAGSILRTREPPSQVFIQAEEVGTHGPGTRTLTSTTVAHFLGGCKQVTGVQSYCPIHTAARKWREVRGCSQSKNRKDLHPAAQNVLRDPCTSGASETVSSSSSVLQTRTLRLCD